MYDAYFCCRKAVEYYHGNKSLPIYECPTKSYSHPALQEELICGTQPVSIESNVSFVVNLSKLKDANDIRADDVGAQDHVPYSAL